MKGYKKIKGDQEKEKINVSMITWKEIFKAIKIDNKRQWQVQRMICRYGFRWKSFWGNTFNIHITYTWHDWKDMRFENRGSFVCLFSAPLLYADWLDKLLKFLAPDTTGKRESITPVFYCCCVDSTVKYVSRYRQIFNKWWSFPRIRP